MVNTALRRNQLADILLSSTDVRFTPESRHRSLSVAALSRQSIQDRCPEQRQNNDGCQHRQNFPPHVHAPPKVGRSEL